MSFTGFSVIVLFACFCCPYQPTVPSFFSFSMLCTMQYSCHCAPQLITTMALRLNEALGITAVAYRTRRTLPASNRPCLAPCGWCRTSFRNQPSPTLCKPGLASHRMRHAFFLPVVAQAQPLPPVQIVFDFGFSTGMQRSGFKCNA